MQYTVTRSFYEGNTLHEAGQPFAHEDKAYVEKCLADGNIAEATDEPVPTTEATATDVPLDAPEAPEKVSDTPSKPSSEEAQVADQPQEPVPSQPTTPQDLTPQEQQIQQDAVNLGGEAPNAPSTPQLG